MDFKSLEDLTYVIRNSKPLNVVITFAILVIQSLQFTRWNDSKRQEYDSYIKSLPTTDDKGNPITYTNEEYIYDEKGNRIPNPHFKPTFEQWLAKKANSETVGGVTNDYAFHFDEANITDDDWNQVKSVLVGYGKVEMKKDEDQGFYSPTAKTKINCGRNDLQNMKSLLSYLTDNSIDKTNFRAYDNNFVEVTQDQLKTMINELIGYGLQEYQKKWNFEQAVQAAKSIDDIKKLAWSCNNNNRT